MERSEIPLNKNAKFYFLLLLSTIPGLCFSSVSIHVIKIGAQDSARCYIESLERRWKFDEIQQISKSVGMHEERFIYNFNYSRLTYMNFEDSNKLVADEYANRSRILCTEFVTKSGYEYNVTFPRELASYCASLNNEFVYDLFALIPSILSCLFVVPLADLYGRKRVLNVGCHIVYFAVFVKIIIMPSVRNVLGQALLNFGYPVMKYTTQAIIFETSDNLRSFTFAATFMGLYISLLLVESLSFLYWIYLQLITYSPVLLLPLVNWYFPESPEWLSSRNENKTAQRVTDAYNDSVKQNENVLFLSNKKTPTGAKEHFSKLKKMHHRDVIFMITLSTVVGFFSFYSYFKHKLLFSEFVNHYVKVVDRCSQQIAVILSCACLFWTTRLKYFLVALFCLNAILFALLSTLDFDDYKHIALVATLVTLAEILSGMTNILFELYLQENFPTSHRCTCAGICGAFTGFALILATAVRSYNMFAGEVLTSISCFVSCILAALMMKHLKRQNPLPLHFTDIQ